jgi:SAM-dependent methyltransferase
MSRELGFSPASVVADVGSGTGILSELFLKNGNQVFGIEPNQKMRIIAEKLLSSYPNFQSIEASAESTGLSSHTVDFITAAQAFHWFEPEKTRQEFRRILKADGWVLLIWNTRKKSTPFLWAYDELVRECSRDQHASRHEDLSDKVLRDFLGENREARFDNSQILDYESLLGRLLSSSYVPLKGSSMHDRMVHKLAGIFARYQVNGVVQLEYDTEVHYSQLP